MNLKKKKLPILQERIEKVIIPRLEDKVVKPIDIMDFRDRNDFFEAWLNGSIVRFSTKHPFIHFPKSDLFFDNLGDITQNLKEADRELSKKIENLSDDLEEYDLEMTRHLQKIRDFYKDAGISKWQNIAELHYYVLWEVAEKKGDWVIKEKLNNCLKIINSYRN